MIYSNLDGRRQSETCSTFCMQERLAPSAVTHRISTLHPYNTRQQTGLAGQQLNKCEIMPVKFTPSVYVRAVGYWRLAVAHHDVLQLCHANGLQAVYACMYACMYILQAKKCSVHTWTCCNEKVWKSCLQMAPNKSTMSGPHLYVSGGPSLEWQFTSYPSHSRSEHCSPYHRLQERLTPSAVSHRVSAFHPCNTKQHNKVACQVSSVASQQHPISAKPSTAYTTKT